MSNTPNKTGGCDQVREYVLDRLRERNCPEDPFVRITSDEIAEAIGISGQAVRKHLAALLERGVFFRQGRSLYSLSQYPPSFPQPSERLQNGCDTVAFELQNGCVMPPTDSAPSCDTVALGLRNGCETVAFCTKSKYQEKEIKINKEKCVDFLGDWVDVSDERYLKAHAYAERMFNRYGAGVRKGTSPALINRFVAGFALGIPLINFPELEEQLKEAEKETALYESFKGFGKQSGIRRPYVRIARYLKKCFEAAGWIWTPCTSPFEFRLKRAHKLKKATPIFPELESEIKPQPGSTTVFQDGWTSNTPQERLPVPAENPQVRDATKLLADSFRIPPAKPQQ